jgi:subtilisin family serine protease
MIAAAGAQDAGEIPHTGVHVLLLPNDRSEEAVARAFAQRPEVAFAELDEIRAPSDVTPNDPYFETSQWHLKKIACPTAWSTTTGSSGVTIAVLDTGVDASHPDLSAKIVPGWNIFDNNSDTRDVYGHGTQVAGTAAASSNNGSGIASVAWGCRIMPIRISDANGYASYSTIANGITWAADHGARVANVSYAGSDSSTVASAAQYLQSKGGVVAMSAGNNGTASSAADNPYVLTVSGTDSNDALYSWSNTGRNIDVAAPGYVTTTTRGGGYAGAAGTSFSAPIVAGVAALVISQNPNLSAQQVQDVIKQSAEDLGTVGWDPSYGWGRVNAAHALGIAASGAVDTTVPVVNITAPTANAIVTGTVNVAISAGDNVGVDCVSLYVDGTLLNTVAASPYNVAWDTTRLPNGTHTLSAVATDTAGNTGASAQVSVTVSNTADTTAPTVAITSYTSGAKAMLSVSATASDNVGVSGVELYVDGTLVATDTSAPYTFSVNTRKWSSGTHTLVCKAYDAAGNVGVSSPVTIY